MAYKSVGKIKADWDSGEGRAELSDAFLEEDGLLRADILKDIIHDLTEAYWDARCDMRGIPHGTLPVSDPCEPKRED